MSVNIIGFICALVLAAIVICWIAYCLFIRERHKSEYYQYNISDIKHRNDVLNPKEDEEVKEEVKAGIIFIPTRHKTHKSDDYEKRPDYPESPSPITPNTGRLVDILNDNGVETTEHYKDGIYEVDCATPYHSDV